MYVNIMKVIISTVDLSHCNLSHTIITSITAWIKNPFRRTSEQIMDIDIGVTGGNKRFLANLVLIIFVKHLEIFFIFFLAVSSRIYDSKMFFTSYIFFKNALKCIFLT